MTPRSKATSLRNAQWADVQTKIGSDVLKHGSYAPVDLILFVDSSESMDDKLPNFLQQLDILVRDWDNAFNRLSDRGRPFPVACVCEHDKCLQSTANA